MVKITTFGFDHSDPPKGVDRLYDLRDLPDRPGADPEVDEKAADIAKETHDGDHIAIGCREGQNRSVVCAHYVRKRLDDKGVKSQVNHMDLRNEYILAPLPRGERKKSMSAAVDREMKKYATD